MRPEEIRPDTALCTILGYNAQSSHSRRYFNGWLKKNSINATAIALNITDEHFDFTMSSVGNSKVDKMILEFEFSQKAIEYCSNGSELERVDFVEVVDGEVVGYSLDSEVDGLFERVELIDERERLVAKMMLIASRWYGVDVVVDEIPLMIDNK
jgi:shikimate 5-dehydrogenase